MRHYPSPSPERKGLALIALLVTLTLASCSDPSESSILLPEADRQSSLVAADVQPAALEWQQLARELVALDRFSTLKAERVYAYLSIAQYGAIVDANEHRFRDRKHDDKGRGGRARRELERGAVTGASRLVLIFFFPAHEPAINQLAEDEASARGNTHPRFRSGLEFGRKMANVLILRAQNDRFTAPFTGTIPTGVGLWIPTGTGTPSGATGGNVLPWVMESGDQFRAPPPPAFGSPAFLTDLAEIRAISDTRTPEQLAISQAWAYPAGTFTPAGHWNQLAARYITEYGLNERDATHVFALMHAAEFDSNVIACSDTKYTYWFLRPYQADPLITAPLGKPNHPSYPSGHSCASSAATTVLAHFFPDRRAELDAQRTEAGLSRMYSGIHYRFDIDAAVDMGTAIAQLAIRIDESRGLMSRIH